MKEMMIGVDLAKRVFQVHGALATGEAQFRKKLSREQFRVFMTKQSPSLVIFEACGSASYWAREMEALGHGVKLIAPQYVRPFVKRQKNDAADRAVSTVSLDPATLNQIDGLTSILNRGNLSPGADFHHRAQSVNPAAPAGTSRGLRPRLQP